MPNNNHTLDVPTLENWLWEAACSVRGPLDAPKYKDYILPLLFYKRLCDVFDDELDALAEEFGGRDLTRQLVEQDRNLTRAYIPLEHCWTAIRRSPVDLGERLTTALRSIGRQNPKLQGVIDRQDFNATEGGIRLLEDEVLAGLMEILNRHTLGLDEVEADILGRAYEYLLRKFAEGSGQSAGEFYTPREVGLLMAHLLEPQEGETIYDPACGSGGLLIKAQLRLRERVAQERGVAPQDLKPGDVGRPLQLYGQEIVADTLAMAKINAFVHDMEARIKRGDTIRNPRFLDDDGRLLRFDKVTANPMWNQNFPVAVYENDSFDRFDRGYPPASSADWGWVQHMAASLTDAGKMALVLDTGAVSRGSGNVGTNKERDLRKAFVEEDLVEAVILLPENLFYNTSAPGIIMAINKAKHALSPAEGGHPGEILLINASKLCDKGRPKNFMTDDHIRQVYQLYRDWRAEDNLSAIVTTQEAARNDYNLSPSRYVATDDIEPPMPLEEAIVLLAEAEESRREVDAKLDEVLSLLGFEEWRNG